MELELGRKADIVRTLLKYPLTTKMLLRASRNWSRPYGNFTALKRDLQALVKEGALARQEIPTTGRGQSPNLYYLRRGAARLVPEVAELRDSSSVFRGFVEAPWHTLAVSRFCAELERSAGETGGRVRILASIRSRYFEIPVSVKTRAGADEERIIPDFTHIVEIGGKPQIIFLELQNRTPLIMPLQDESVTRSFRFKLTRYKALAAAGTLRGHHQVAHLEKVLRVKFDGFRVLVVTTQGEVNKRHLMVSSRSRSYDKLFLFATMEETVSGNVFTDRIWSLASGKCLAIVP